MKRLCLTIEDFFQLKSAVLYDAEKIKPVTKVAIDSRNVPSGSLFIAIKGDKFDGHDFIIDAVNKGAVVVLINGDKLSSLENIDVPVITVSDTTLALGELAAIWRRKLETKVIGITGSAGKTTTKEMIFTLLSGKYKVNKTLGNNNNHIGVPLTLFSTERSHDYLVLELGTNHFGEIKYTAEIAKPDYAIITNIGNSHLEFLKDRRGVFEEKAALLNVTASNNGTLFINNDDPLLFGANKKYSRRFTFGLEKKSDVKGEIAGYTAEGKPIVNISYKGKSSSFEVPLYGEQSAKNFLAAAAIAYKIGLRSEEIKRRLKKIQAVDKRLNVQRMNNFILINDTYNANPDSMEMSLQLLAQIKKYNNRVAILGDMFELGKQSRELHEKLSGVIVRNKINSVYTVGKMMKHLYPILKAKKIDAIHFNDRGALNNFLKEKSFTNSIVLVKGSRGMKMEEFVETIKLNNK
jgi:UDP-N-acetylmuramoyl-tripeptide--D-alanyl-D-alanine ligase